MKRWTAILAAVALAALALTAQETRESGRITGVAGVWISSLTNHEIHRDDLVLAGETIYPSPKTEKGALTISFFGHGRLSEHPQKLCVPNTADCPSTYLVPTIVEEVSLLARLQDAARALFPKEVRQLHFAVSYGARGPQEAVLLAGSKRPDLAPALLPVSPGEYTVELAAWSIHKGPSADTFRSKLLWQEGEADVRFESELPAGLYQLRVIDEHQETVGAQAIVLLRSPEQFKKSAQAFEKLSQSLEAVRLQKDTKAPDAWRQFCVQALMAIELRPELTGPTYEAH